MKTKNVNFEIKLLITLDFITLVTPNFSSL